MVQAPWSYLTPPPLPNELRPCAVVPVHPREGRLWANVRSVGGETSLPSYPVDNLYDEDTIRAALSRHCRPAFTPVPISERLPGPEDCAPWPDEPEADPWCWAARHSYANDPCVWSQVSVNLSSRNYASIFRAQGYTHWAPW